MRIVFGRIALRDALLRKPLSGEVLAKGDQNDE